MKLNKIASVAFLALAGVASTMHAQVSAVAGDLVFGVRATNGSGQTLNLEVDLGSATLFQSGGGLATGAWESLPKLSLNDLTGTYSDWTRTGLFFSVAGTTNTTAVGSNPARTTWVTQGTTAPGGSTAVLNASSTTAANRASKISNIYTGLNGQPATPNSASAATVLASGGQSWSTLESASGNWGGFFGGNEQSTSLATGGFAYLDLYQVGVGTGPGTLLGTFRLSDVTGLQFLSAGAAVPEPSTYAALLGAAALGFVVLRRRRQAVVA